MRLLVIAIVLASACGSSRDDAERKARAAQAEAESRAAALRVKAEEARARADALRHEAAVLVADTVARAGELDPTRAKEIALAAKAELDKVYKTTSDYDLDVTTANATNAHAEKLAAMPHVTVGNLTVGYEQVSGLSVTGTTSKRHFRATWRRGDKDVIVGYQTSAELDVVAFAKLLPKLVPIIEKLL